jgi:hypothetical protein
MKTTSNGRRPQNIESGISLTIMYKSFKWRRPPREDGLKILKVEYLSNRLLDHTKISNFSLDDQIIFFKASKWRWKMTSNGKWPHKIKSRVSQQPLYWMRLMGFEGEIRGELIGNLECGSAQPSLFGYLNIK